jgi:hypothetical protein
LQALAVRHGGRGADDLGQARLNSIRL